MKKGQCYFEENMKDKARQLIDNWTMGLQAKLKVQVELCQQRDRLFELKGTDCGLEWRKGVRQLNIFCSILWSKRTSWTLCFELGAPLCFLFVSSWMGRLTGVCVRHYILEAHNLSGFTGS